MKHKFYGNNCKDISAVSPQEYQKRFVNFIKESMLVSAARTDFDKDAFI